MIPWSEAVKIPSPDWIQSIFWQLMVYFWKGEISEEFYATHRFPVSVDEIRLVIDHRFRETVRYHVFEMQGESSGILDESPFWIHYQGFQDPPTSTTYLEHGDYRHAFQAFIRSFLNRIKRYCPHYPDLDRLHKMLKKMKILTWRCPVCRIFNTWNRQFIEDQLLLHQLSIAPSTLLFLLSYENQALRCTRDEGEDTADPDELLRILQKCLSRFFKEFEPIYEGTSIDILIILKNLIDILRHHGHDRALEDIPLFEREVCRDMKDYLYKQFKFIHTLSITNIPRDLWIARDVFAAIVHQWNRSYRDPDRSFSPGLIILLHYLLFEDRALRLRQKDKVIVLYPSIGTVSSDHIRPMTPPEMEEFTEYHPLLRSFLFLPPSPP